MPSIQLVAKRISATLSLRIQVLLIAALLPLGAQANQAEQALDTVVDTHNAGSRSQQRINRIDDASRELIEQYRVVTRQTDTLKVYNSQLQRLIDSQLKEMQSLQQQIQDIEITQREITPLMLRMLDSLEQFIALDVPFLPDEREQRLTRLEDTLNRADVSVSEKFRQLVEAYQIENDYGRTIEAYRAPLNSGAGPRTVDFLRIGRVGLFYQTLDGKELGRWDKASESWVAMDSSYRSALNQGLRIARKQAAPDLLVLPVSAPTMTDGGEG